MNISTGSFEHVHYHFHGVSVCVCVCVGVVKITSTDLSFLKNNLSNTRPFYSYLFILNFFYTFHTDDAYGFIRQRNTVKSR